MATQTKNFQARAANNIARNRTDESDEISLMKAQLAEMQRRLDTASKLDADYFINVQGDEPVFNPGDISLLIEAISQYPDDVLNGAVPELYSWIPTIPGAPLWDRLAPK